MIKHKHTLIAGAEEMLGMCDDVKKICMPLFLYLKIRYFRVVRSYPDGTKFILCSNNFWLKQYFDEAFYNVEYAHYDKIADGSEGISIHGLCDAQNPVCQFWTKLGPYCGYNYILAMYKKNDEYMELFDFGLSEDSHVSQNIFLNNPKIFKHFIQYFYEEAKPLMEKAYLHRFTNELSPGFDTKKNWMLGLQKDYEKKVLECMQLDKIYIGDNLADAQLSVTEVRIILMLSKGFEKKEILEKIGIDKSEFKDTIHQIFEKLNVKSEGDLKKEVFRRKLLSSLMLIK